jgi:hypothetical protein
MGEMGEFLPAMQMYVEVATKPNLTPSVWCVSYTFTPGAWMGVESKWARKNRVGGDGDQQECRHDAKVGGVTPIVCVS